MLLNILSLIIGGLGIGGLITFFVTRHDTKKGLEAKLHKVEKDSVRIQILLLMFNYKETDKEELLRCAEYYFKKKEDGGLEADWYMTDMFKRFLKDKKIEQPNWFK